uniref:Uncharacterized protein n=1 Tax=Panagrolaimus sp. ES5 TaxID=591445 RepID=A0AC34GGI6_9BILA
MGKFKPKYSKKKPVSMMENAPPQQEEDAFNMEDMIEEVDPSQLVGLERKAFKRKPSPDDDSDEEDLKNVKIIEEPKKKKQMKEKKPKELVNGKAAN